MNTLGPVCHGTIAKVFIGHSKYPYDYTCNGTWKGKVKMGTPHVVDLGHELEHVTSQAAKKIYDRAFFSEIDCL